jgi:pimeloyl-ACP methyl ester carboxylesterase
MAVTDVTVRVNGVNLFYELAGSGEPLVLVHGGWTDHSSWQFVVPQLAESFRVLAYDRRGHSRSERPATQGSRRTDEDDLAALIEAFDLAPAHLVGNSYGASISLGLASRRPDLVRSVIAHEPPLLGTASDNAQLRPMMAEIRGRLEAVARQLRLGDIEAGVARFIEEVALGPGMWEQIPVESRRMFMHNAPTFLDSMGDPRWADLDLETLTRCGVPVLLTDGRQSPPWLPAIVTEIARVVAGVGRHTFASGHVPHLTEPDEHVRTICEFLRAHAGSPTVLAGA